MGLNLVVSRNKEALVNSTSDDCVPVMSRRKVRLLLSGQMPAPPSMGKGKVASISRAGSATVERLRRRAADGAFETSIAPTDGAKRQGADFAWQISCRPLNCGSVWLERATFFCGRCHLVIAVAWPPPPTAECRGSIFRLRNMVNCASALSN